MLAEFENVDALFILSSPRMSLILLKIKYLIMGSQ